MPRFNRERMARRDSEGLVYGPLHDWIKTLSCDLAGRFPHECEFYPDRKRVESHHVKSVGSGGEDRNNTVPVCPGGHDEFHRIGLVSMCDKYRRDFRSVACDYTADFDRVTALETETE